MKTQVLKTLSVYDGIDILINNAGISYRGEVINTDIDVDMKVMMSNYFSQVCLTKSKFISIEKFDVAVIFIHHKFAVVIPLMIKQNSGHIVGISSVQGRIAIPYR